MQKGDHLSVGYGYNLDECLAVAIQGEDSVSYYLVSLKSGSAIVELKDEGWYPARKMHIVSFEFNPRFETAELPTGSWIAAVQNELKEYFE